MTQRFKRPPWRDPAAYDGLKTASLGRIAWEFLRRNPDYEAAWTDLTNHAAMLERRGPKVVLQEFGDDLPNVLLRASVERAEPWGLNMMVDPSTDGASFMFAETGWTYTLVDKGTGIPQTPDNPHGLQKQSKWLVVKVDLSLPLNVIDSQLRAAVRDEREARQKRGVLQLIDNRAQSIDLYIKYLRILDGAAAGADTKELGEVLAPLAANDEERQRDKLFHASLKEAIRLQRDGYRVLPFLESVAQRKN